jgi:hypothetical protein
MTLLYDIDFEGGDLTEWTGTSGGGVTDTTSAFSVTAGAALAGTNYGLAVTANGSTAAQGYHYPINSTSGVIRARFYIDPNGVTMTSGTLITIFNCYNASVVIMVVQLFYNSTYGYGIYFRAYDDAAGTNQIGPFYDNFGDEPHYIEVLMTRASTTSSNDGVSQIWIDGTSVGSVTNLDNNTRFNEFDWYYFGKVVNADGATGTFYLDQLIIRDDNTAIGAHSTGASNAPRAMHNRRMQGMS